MYQDEEYQDKRIKYQDRKYSESVEEIKTNKLKS